MDLKLTPLTQEHQKLGAQMGPFGGWLMPIQYSGILTEHAWTRQQVSLFDICHMGEFLIDADAQKSGLNRIVSANLEVMSVGSCRYTSMLNESGGIIDDLIVYRLKIDQWMFVVNASRIDIDAAHIKRHLSKDAKFEDLSARLGKLDLQGPLAHEVLRQLLGSRISALTYYTFDHFVLLGENNVVSRTGYTGELGYELYLSNEKIAGLWNLLLKDNRVKPAGLGARDTLRLEMGYTLYGQDIDENITPLEAGMENVPLLSRATNLVRSEDRQIVSSAQDDILDALLYLSTGAAYNKEQLAQQKSAYLPSWSDKPATREIKRQRLVQAIEGARVRAGRAWSPELDAAMQQLLASPAMRSGQQTAPAAGAPPAGARPSLDSIFK